MSSAASFRGLAVALATPFDERGALDLSGFRNVVRHVRDGGADTLVVLGSTGEAATLEDDERDVLVRACVAERGRCAVVVGCGSSSTAQAARFAARARELGADGALVVTPPYNKPMPEGLERHFRAIAAASPGFPLIAYNVPGRTGQNLTPAILPRLWAIDEVVALKESSGNVGQIAQIAHELPATKTLLAGDDNLALASIAVGAAGLVSVVGNVLPRETKELVEAARAGDLPRARELERRLAPLVDALFCESNPIPLKAALALFGLAGDNLRLPLTRPTAATTERVRAALAGFL